VDVNSVLVDILVVLVAAKIAAEIADRINVPAVVAEIVAGVIVGPSVFGFVDANAVINTLAQLGVILLLLEVGMEMDLRELRSVGRASIAVAVVGVIVPMVTGTIAGLGLGFDGNEAVFVGAALTATSVGITARVFGDLRALASVEARTVLGAAVADDILGLVILTVVTRIVTEGSVSATGIFRVTFIAIGFVVVATVVGLRMAPPIFAVIRRHSRSTGTMVAAALAFTLALAALAHAADLAPIIGAFVAGLALARTNSAERIRTELGPVGHLFIPIFFLQIGIDADVHAFARPKVLGIAAVLLVIAVLGKLAAAAGLFGSPGDRLLVGIGMIPRGEVGLIFATLGLNQHVFGQDVYGALILVVLATTIGTPAPLRWRLLRLRARSRVQPATSGVSSEAVVAVDGHGRVQITGEPLPSQALGVALTAARLCENNQPGDSLLEWLSAFPPGPRAWDDAARSRFWRLLEDGGPRSWRLLTSSGVLQRALPELDDALSLRVRTAYEIDPLSGLRFRRLERVREQLSAADEPRTFDVLMVAALVLDACDDVPVEPVVVARRTVQRLGLGTPVEQAVAALVTDANLLAAASRRVDALSEESVLALAVHLGTGEQARALYLLTRATFLGEEWERERVDALYELVQQALLHPELTGRAAANEVEARKAEATAGTTDPAVRQRIAAAPREYVLAVGPTDLLRHAQLCEPPPRRSDIRVRVDALEAGHRVEVAARDRIGLIARVTWALTEAGCDVTRAQAVTWADGVALSSYRVVPASPDAASLERRLRELLRARLQAHPLPTATLTFDDHGSPWHTRCIVEAPDARGLLRDLTAAFADAGLNVHAASITTDGTVAVDTFELTDRNGAKLDDPAKARLRDVIAHGVPGRSRRISTA
jgi:Kef-type K+ transport system membrane component KefB/glycine cleavage system regulatory protein